MPSTSTHTTPRPSLDNVHFTALPGTEATASVGTVGTGTAAVGGTTSLALTLKTLTSFLISLKFLFVVLGVIVVSAVAVALSVVLSTADISAYSADNNTSNVTTTATSFSPSASVSTHSLSTPTVKISTSSQSSTQSSSSSSSSSSSLSSSSSSPTSTSLTSMTTIISTSEPMVPTTTPSHNVCLETDFPCHNGQCVDVTLMCDGIPDCSDGSDEGIPCACSSYQFTCANGQCITSYSRCNLKPECIDNSDEMDCPGCRGFQCESNKLCLWDVRRRCDGVFDCADLSDEKDCALKSRHKKCDNGVQVPRNLWCNGVDDCRDNSDEKDCDGKCVFYEVSCKGNDNRCISRSLLCDGHQDCDQGTDEIECGKCQPEEFQCADYSCIAKTSVCDSIIDCHHGGTDEKGCFTIDMNNVVHVLLNGNKLPLCSEGWGEQQSSDFCYSQQQGSLRSWTSSEWDVPLYANLKPGSEEVLIQHFSSSAECKSGKVVRVRCQQSECGERQTPVLSSFIAGGDITPLGKWPWVVSLAYLRKPICGASIVGSRWVLTAAHCVMQPISKVTDFTSAPFYFTVTAGTTNITPKTTNVTTLESSTSHKDPADSTRGDLNFQTLRVSKIHLHPKATKLSDGGVDWDLALLELSGDFHYTDTVQPLCLPSEGKVFPRTSVCYMAGWGMLSYSQPLMPEKLRDTRMTLWQDPKCRRNVVLTENEVNINSTLCAGFNFGKPTACKGDSGAPLMCLERGSSRWSLAGIMSRGQNSCGQFKPNALGNRFARVSTSTSWIINTMGGG